MIIEKLEIGVIGGGAAGFFGAIRAAEVNAEAEVFLLEKTSKLLSKVRISGGGRCNVTHACFDNTLLVQNYPRGMRELRGPFEKFTTKDTIEWFKKRGVKLKTEADGRMFPVTDNSETIAQCLLDAAQKAGVKILLNTGVNKLIPQEEGGFVAQLQNGKSMFFDKILVAAGGGPKAHFFDWLKELGHTIVEPVPSLFTFNLPKHPLNELPGISVENAHLKILNTKLEQSGPLLITHWGVSGPAVLKLSAWGARVLHDLDYNFTLKISWLPNFKEDELRAKLNQLKSNEAKKQLSTFSPFGFPMRLWKWMLQNSNIREDLKWVDASKKDINSLTETLLNTQLQVKGKSTYKDEFVTAGGISLKDVDMKTFESKKCPGLYFAGEVLDIDGVTGGFNFQAAWTGGFIAGENMNR